jgi:hypothetical protein
MFVSELLVSILEDNAGSHPLLKESLEERSGRILLLQRQNKEEKQKEQDKKKGKVGGGQSPSTPVEDSSSPHSSSASATNFSSTSSVVGNFTPPVLDEPPVLAGQEDGRFALSLGQCPNLEPWLHFD